MCIDIASVRDLNLRQLSFLYPVGTGTTLVSLQHFETTHGSLD
jgi:hypothetical protein